ncbi:hypothetical protein [Haloarcula litorea]|nr:hypothetical protein [Halomicroarcula sp. GDY20]
MSSSLDDHLRAALAAAENDETRYHLRTALQLRVCETDRERLRP